LALGRPRLLGNLEYSIPPGQLPIVLLPGERRRIAVCVTPLSAGRQVDTLILDFQCGTIDERVQMVTFVDPLLLSGRDRCGNELDVAVGGAAKRNFLALPRPNPAAGATATLSFGLSVPTSISISIHDAHGTIVDRLLDNDAMPAGISQIEARVDRYPSGTYFVRMSTSNGTVMSEKLLIQR
ncbi:MAG: T9SS type A sorting domain-containing protein, partial [bacterium]|nr:T9SS type A sorting domain-containing protein [Candidatus Kapabacteria bacterium]